MDALLVTETLTPVPLLTAEIQEAFVVTVVGVPSRTFTIVLVAADPNERFVFSSLGAAASALETISNTFADASVVSCPAAASAAGAKPKHKVSINNKTMLKRCNNLFFLLIIKPPNELFYAKK